MGINGIFNQTISLLEQSLDLRAMKHKTIASNVANIDTPNYKAFDVMVEDALKRQGHIAQAGTPTRAVTTREGHIEPRRSMADGVRRRQRSVNDNQIMRRDGNNVDLDREMATMSANSLMYTLSAQIVARKFQSLRNVIQGGNK